MPTFKIAVVATLLLLFLQLSGCGRKGPLFMERAPVAGATVSQVKSEAIHAASNPAAQSPSETNNK